MTVQKLMEFLAKQDPNALVVVPSNDHSFRMRVSVGTTNAVLTDDHYLGEHYNGMSLASDEKVIKVVVID
jgi:hypothetical protein